MRISDWSSDVCSSDLRFLGGIIGRGKWCRDSAAHRPEIDNRAAAARFHMRKHFLHRDQRAFQSGIEHPVPFGLAKGFKRRGWVGTHGRLARAETLGIVDEEDRKSVV